MAEKECPGAGTPGCLGTFEDRSSNQCRRWCSNACRNRVLRREGTRDRGHLPQNTIVELKHFSKLTPAGKQRVLLGQEGFRIVGFDIEATHLKANVGRILCVSFKPLDGDVYTFHAHERRFMRRDVYDDSALAAATRDELEKFDVVVGWNSKMFDIKFINARNLRADQRTKVAQYHVDGMWSWRSKAAAWSGLDAVQKFVAFDGPEKSTIAWDQWMRCIGWDAKLRKQAMDDIVHHCELDVTVLELVYKLMVRNDVVRGLRRDGGIL